MAEIKLTKQNFQNEVINSDIPVLVDFWATWCGPCRMIAPIISEIAEEANERFKVGKVNVDEESELASMFRIMSIPTLMVFKDGKLVNTVVGLRSKADLLAILN
jgi:thioredoxin